MPFYGLYYFDNFTNTPFIVTAIVVVKNWSSAKSAYELSRRFCFKMHEKKEKLAMEYEKVNPI